MLGGLKSFVRDRPALRAAALGLQAFGRHLHRAPPGLYTLCYHHVHPGAATRFARQIAFLQHHGTFRSADDALARLRGGAPATERTFLLTFDDGYRDTLEIAAPVLRDHGVPAILFLVSDWLRTPPDDGQAYLSNAGVEAWLRAGFAIGSHSASHRQISRLSAAEATDDFARSGAALAALAGTPIRHFACPWGVAERDYQPERDPALASAAGFETFFTTRRGVAGDGRDLPVLPRHVLEPEWPLHQLHALMGGPRLGRA